MFADFSALLSGSFIGQTGTGGGHMYGYLDRFGSFHYFGYVSNVQYPITNVFGVLLTLPFVPIATMTNTFDNGFVSFCHFMVVAVRLDFSLFCVLF